MLYQGSVRVDKVRSILDLSGRSLTSPSSPHPADALGGASL